MFAGDFSIPLRFSRNDENETSIKMNINFVEIFGAFFVMAAIIDIFGSIPIFVSMREQDKVIKAG